MKTFWKAAFAIAKKDILLELRSKEIISSVLLFAVLTLVIFHFAFTADHKTMTEIAPGMLWVAFSFAGILSLNRAFIPEKEDNCMEGLLSCPVGREAIYMGKCLGSFIFMLIVEAVVIPVCAMLFNVDVFNPMIIFITLLATIGFVSVGIIFSALSVNTRAREMVLPILFLPIIVPIIICAVSSSSAILAGGTFEDIKQYLLIIVAFDVIFFTVPLMIFKYVVEE